MLPNYDNSAAYPAVKTRMALTVSAGTSRRRPLGDGKQVVVAIHVNVESPRFSSAACRAVARIHRTIAGSPGDPWTFVAVPVVEWRPMARRPQLATWYAVDDAPTSCQPALRPLLMA